MNEHTITAIVSVLLAVTGLAIIAVLVSKQANTTGVFTSGGGAIQQMICTALSPVTGNKNCRAGIPSVSSTINFGGIVP